MPSWNRCAERTDVSVIREKDWGHHTWVSLSPLGLLIVYLNYNIGEGVDQAVGEGLPQAEVFQGRPLHWLVHNSAGWCSGLGARSNHLLKLRLGFASGKEAHEHHADFFSHLLCWMRPAFKHGLLRSHWEWAMNLQLCSMVDFHITDGSA